MGDEGSEAAPPKEAGVVSKERLIDAAAAICEQRFIPSAAYVQAARDATKPPQCAAAQQLASLCGSGLQLVKEMQRKKLFEKNSAAFGPAFAGSGPGGAAVSVRRRKGTADDEILVSGGGGFGAKVLGAGGSGGGSCSSSRPSSQAVRRRAEIAGLNRTS